MKQIILVLASFIIAISAGSQANGADTILTATEVNALFSDKTMTVITTGYKKKSEKEPFKVHTSNIGAARGFGKYPVKVVS